MDSTTCSLAYWPKCTASRPTAKTIKVSRC
jgi:hypothetical protein